MICRDVKRVPRVSANTTCTVATQWNGRLSILYPSPVWVYGMFSIWWRPRFWGWNSTERKPKRKKYARRPGKETEKNRLDRDAWEGGGCVVAVDWEIRSGYQRPASAWMKQETVGHRYASVNFRQGCVLCMWAGLTAKTGRALKLHGESKSRRREATHRA